jgi:hypothetical protein
VLVSTANLAKPSKLHQPIAGFLYSLLLIFLLPICKHSSYVVQISSRCEERSKLNGVAVCWSSVCQGRRPGRLCFYPSFRLTSRYSYVCVQGFSSTGRHSCSIAFC